MHKPSWDILRICLCVRLATVGFVAADELAVVAVHWATKLPHRSIQVLYSIVLCDIPAPTSLSAIWLPTKRSAICLTAVAFCFTILARSATCWDKSASTIHEVSKFLLFYSNYKPIHDGLHSMVTTFDPCT